MTDNPPTNPAETTPVTKGMDRLYSVFIILGVLAVTALCAFYVYEVVQMSQGLTWHDVYTTFLKG